MENVKMTRVSGIGGVFFRANDPEALTSWYREHLGLPVDEGGYVMFQSGGPTTWNAFERNTEYFGPSGQQWMINYRVENLDALLESLEAAGVEIVPNREEYDFGRFAWIVDPEGNRVELWEPKG